MTRRNYWQILSAVALASACVCPGSSAQIHFPLHVGDSWDYLDCCSIECDGDAFISFIVGDTLIGGRTYAKFSYASPFSGPYVRADSARVFEYDTTTRAEYVIFDFRANPGDTVSTRDRGYGAMIALGSLRFMEGMVTFTIRDSIGVVEIYSQGSLCDFKLRGAFINGQRVTLGIASHDGGFPATPLLEQDYPNPFNPSTTIRYALPQRTHVTLTVFNPLGQTVATLVNAVEEPGEHSVRFDGEGLASGVYFYRLTAGSFVRTMKMLVLR